MPGTKILIRMTIGCLVMLVYGAVSVAVVKAEDPSRFDVLYADSLEPIELEAGILDLNLLERHIIVGEQTVLLVEEEEAQPPVTPTVFYSRAGKKVGPHALKVRQRVRVKGFQHMSGQIIALEIQILQQAHRRQGQKKRE